MLRGVQIKFLHTIYMKFSLRKFNVVRFDEIKARLEISSLRKAVLNEPEF